MENILGQIDKLGQVEYVIVGAITLFSLPVVAFPIIMVKNYKHHNTPHKKSSSQERSFNLAEIEKLFSNQSTSQNELEEAVKTFVRKFAKLPDEKDKGITKERFAHHLVMLNYLAQHANSSKKMIEDLGKAFIEQNPDFKKEFEVKVAKALQGK